MKKIAIIQLVEISGNYDESYLQTHITDWTEVSDEEYRDLYKGLNYLNNDSYKTGVEHRIIILPNLDTIKNPQKEFILKLSLHE